MPSTTTTFFFSFARSLLPLSYSRRRLRREASMGSPSLSFVSSEKNTSYASFSSSSSSPSSLSLLLLLLVLVTAVVVTRNLLILFRLPLVLDTEEVFFSSLATKKEKEEREGEPIDASS